MKVNRLPLLGVFWSRRFMVVNRLLFKNANRLLV